MAPLHRQYKNRANRNSPASAIENKADADSDIGFARLCFVRHKGGIYATCCLVPIRDTHKSPTNCLPGCGHDPRSAPNLERHGSSKMQTFGWLEMPHFLIRISRYIPSEIEKHDFLSYYFSQQKGQPVSCGSPFFFISSLNRLHALRRLKAKQIDADLKHRLRQL